MQSLTEPNLNSLLEKPQSGAKDRLDCGGARQNVL